MLLGLLEMSSKLLNFSSATSSTSGHSRYINNSSTAVASSTITSSSCSFNYENLQLDDILCPVCTSVLVEPVYLPCQHLFCRNCLSQTIATNKLNCPCCRKRFGTWYRNASRVNKLVHERLWQAIQSQFRDHLAEDGAPGPMKGTANGSKLPMMSLANPGEIRQEFSEDLKRYQKQRHEDMKKELVATEQCIINLYKNEGIIDLADNSSHVSVSSTTTPELHDGNVAEKTPNVSTHSPTAGPSLLCSARRPIAGKDPGWNKLPEGGGQKSLVPAASKPTKSPSNGSVISISSTSSAQSAVTASSCASSSASDRYSLLKSVVQQVGASAELVKQKVQGSILHRLTAGKLQQHQKTLTTLDLNKSEYCVKPTTLHKTELRRRKDEESNDEGALDDTDSLKSEQNHFIPIIASLPKSSFSLDRLVHVSPVRPSMSGVEYHLTPKKNSYRPQKVTPARLSAFTVVNLLTPPKTPPEGSSAKSKGKSKPPTSTPRRGRRRRVKLKFTVGKSRKTSTTRNTDDPAANCTAAQSANTRTTRRTIEAQTKEIRDLIISDQQRRERQIEMERRDFEFAQKLQEKLNRSSGIMQEIHRQYPVPRNTGYSLRRKTTGDCLLHGGDNSGCSKEQPPSESSPQERCSKKTSAQKSRKRKATSSSVENDVPSSSSPTKPLPVGPETARQTRQSRTNKLNANLSVSASAASVELQPIPQRKSTRNKTR